MPTAPVPTPQPHSGGAPPATQGPVDYTTALYYLAVVYPKYALHIRPLIGAGAPPADFPHTPYALVPCMDLGDGTYIAVWVDTDPAGNPYWRAERHIAPATGMALAGWTGADPYLARNMARGTMGDTIGDIPAIDYEADGNAYTDMLYVVDRAAAYGPYRPR